MLEALLLEQAKAVATQHAADLAETVARTEQTLLKTVFATAIRDAREARNTYLSALGMRAQSLMQGKSSGAFQQRVTIVKAYNYHQDGVNSVE